VADSARAAGHGPKAVKKSPLQRITGLLRRS
jgi:hypothetical protein